MFVDKNYYLCDECIKKYPAKYTYVTVPFDSLVHVFSVFDTYYDVNPIAFLLERKVLMELVMSKFNLNKEIFLYYDSFDEMLKDEENINMIFAFNRKIIVVVTYYLKF
ncbi:MAG: hypothetical protein K6E24_01425 [bacterium]|nr:hypothetical protein [bacterium]